jgi:hypothetical protein
MNKEFPPGKSEQEIFVWREVFFLAVNFFLGGMPLLLRCCSQCVNCVRVMPLANAIAASFIHALCEDFYPIKDIERLFGIQMGTQQGQIMLGAWQTLFKHDGFVTVASISQALCTDTLPEAFKRWLHQSHGSGYTAELLATGLESVPWMRMTEFKFV